MRRQTATAQEQADKTVSLSYSQTVEARAPGLVEDNVVIGRWIARDDEEVCPFCRRPQAPCSLQGGSAVRGRLEMDQHLVLVCAKALDLFNVRIGAVGAQKRRYHEQRHGQQQSATVHLYTIRDVRVGGKFPVFADIIAIIVPLPELCFEWLY